MTGAARCICALFKCLCLLREIEQSVSLLLVNIQERNRFTYSEYGKNSGFNTLL